MLFFLGLDVGLFVTISAVVFENFLPVFAFYRDVGVVIDFPGFPIFEDLADRALVVILNEDVYLRAGFPSVYKSGKQGLVPYFRVLLFLK